MIKKLILRDFQSHYNTGLDFSPGVNVITGTSNSGKTAVIRGLKWLITNRPLGDSIVRKGSKYCEVLVHLLQEGNPVVRRVRDKSQNLYEFSIDEEKEEFTAFGSGVPLEITELLNFSEINIQSQHDSYFLVFDSPGQVAAYINKVTKLDEVDRIVSDIASQIRISEKDIKSTTASLNETVDKIKEFNKFDLEGFQQLLESSEEIDQELSELTLDEKELSRIVSELKEVDDNIIHVPRDAYNLIEEIEQLNTEVTSLKDNIDCLSKIIQQFNTLREIKLDPQIRILIEEIQENYLEYIETEDLFNGISDFLDKIKDIDCKIYLITPEKEEVERQLSEYYSKLTICPTCGEELSEKGKKHILEGLE